MILLVALVSILALALCGWVIKRVVSKEGMNVKVFFQLERRKVILSSAIAVLSFFLGSLGLGILIKEGWYGLPSLNVAQSAIVIMSAILCWPAIPGLWAVDWVWGFTKIGILYHFWVAVVSLVYWYFLACLIIACFFKVRSRENKRRVSSALKKWLFVSGSICLLIIAAVTAWKFLLVKHCKGLNTSEGLGLCLGKNVRVNGKITCKVPADWEGVVAHYLVLDDGSLLKIFTEYPCEMYGYDGRQVTVYGELYRCHNEDVCSGIGLKEILSIRSRWK